MERIDLDLFNKEQRPFNYDGDCLEFGEWLYNTWRIDYSDELYEAWRDEQLEKELEEQENLYEYEYDYD
jgi:hypothetical protein